MSQSTQPALFAGPESESSIVARFTVPGEPASKARPRFDHRNSKSHVYTPEKTKAAEAKVAACYLATAHKLGTDPDVTYGVLAHFYNGTHQRRDVDNMVKLVLDGLNKVAFPDDVQVVEVVGRKSFVPKKDARTEVVLYRVGEVDRLTKKCKHCGNDFITWPSLYEATKYCSRACREKEWDARQAKTCEQCGKSFKDSHERRFCSKECRNESMRVDVTCIVCGKTVRKRKSAKAQNFCSDACLHQHMRNQQKKLGKGPGTCVTCGGAVSRKEYKQCWSCRHQAPLTRRVYGKPQITSKLTEDDVRTIRSLHSDGARPFEIAKNYPVSASTIRAIIARKTWTWVG